MGQTITTLKTSVNTPEDLITHKVSSSQLRASAVDASIRTLETLDIVLSKRHLVTTTDAALTTGWFFVLFSCTAEGKEAAVQRTSQIYDMIMKRAFPLSKGNSEVVRHLALSIGILSENETLQQEFATQETVDALLNGFDSAATPSCIEELASCMSNLLYENETVGTLILNNATQLANIFAKNLENQSKVLDTVSLRMILRTINNLLASSNTKNQKKAISTFINEKFFNLLLASFPLARQGPATLATLSSSLVTFSNFDEGYSLFIPRANVLALISNFTIAIQSHIRTQDPITASTTRFGTVISNVAVRDDGRKAFCCAEVVDFISKHIIQGSSYKNKTNTGVISAYVVKEFVTAVQYLRYNNETKRILFETESFIYSVIDACNDLNTHSITDPENKEAVEALLDLLYVMCQDAIAVRKIVSTDQGAGYLSALASMINSGKSAETICKLYVFFAFDSEVTYEAEEKVSNSINGKTVTTTKKVQVSSKDKFFGGTDFLASSMFSLLKNVNTRVGMTYFICLIHVLMFENEKNSKDFACEKGFLEHLKKSEVTKFLTKQEDEEDDERANIDYNKHGWIVERLEEQRNSLPPEELKKLTTKVSSSTPGYYRSSVWGTENGEMIDLDS